MTRPWIEWRGGECPVAEGVCVDVKHRDGEIYQGHRAGINDGYSFAAFEWFHIDEDGDIIAYRLAGDA